MNKEVLKVKTSPRAQEFLGEAEVQWLVREAIKRVTKPVTQSRVRLAVHGCPIEVCIGLHQPLGIAVVQLASEGGFEFERTAYDDGAGAWEKFAADMRKENE